MDATHNFSSRSHNFTVTHEGKPFEVTIYTNESGKFIDEEVKARDESKVSPEIVKLIVEYLSEHWHELVFE